MCWINCGVDLPRVLSLAHACLGGIHALDSNKILGMVVHHYPNLPCCNRCSRVSDQLVPICFRLIRAFPISAKPEHLALAVFQLDLPAVSITLCLPCVVCAYIPNLHQETRWTEQPPCYVSDPPTNCLIDEVKTVRELPPQFCLSVIGLVIYDHIAAQILEHGCFLWAPACPCDSAVTHGLGPLHCDVACASSSTGHKYILSFLDVSSDRQAPCGSQRTDRQSSPLRAWGRHFLQKCTWSVDVEVH
mmetsp:Transcript_127583/g.207823  ORF Transcript_127583/g.207823 Transcript_127583/m.207823 type:complete len:246 (+) Transcript_127583:113-850(+)